MVRIDASQVEGTIYDFTQEACLEAFLTNSIARNFARADQEVVIDGFVPSSAVTVLP